MISTIISTISAVITVYTILCLVDIIMSWVPGAKFTKFGRAISSICDPYMNLFSRIPFTRIGNIDFSPIISLGILSIVSSILSGISSTGRLYFGSILATIIYMLWNIFSSFLSIFILVIIIRWIAELSHRGKITYDSAWNQLDRLIMNPCYKIAGTFFKKHLSYKTALLISLITLIIIDVAGGVLIRILASLCYRIPF